MGKTERLYDHHGKVIILDFSAMWCGPCKFAALDVDDMVEKYGSENVVYITVLIENSSGHDPRLKDLQTWSEDLGVVNNPVLGANREWLRDSGYYLEAWPTFYILTPTMVIKENTREDIERKISKPQLKVYFPSIFYSTRHLKVCTRKL